MPNSDIREILRPVHASHPEAAKAVEERLSELESTINQLSSRDPFRTFVLSMGDTLSRSVFLMDRLEQGPLSDLAQAALLKEQRLDKEQEQTETKQGAIIAFLKNPSGLVTASSLLMNILLVIYAAITGDSAPLLELGE